MTPYYELSAMAHGICGVCAMVLMAAALLLLVAVCVLKMGRRYLIPSCVLTATVLFLLQGVADVNVSLSRGLLRPAFFAGVIGGLPCAAVILILLLLAAAVGFLLAFLGRRRKSFLSPGAIKESLDALPDGVCFFETDGQPLLVNTQMNRISGQLTGAGLLNAERFWSALNGGTVARERVPAGSSLAVRTGDNKVWDFRRSALAVGEDRVWELIAYDVTAQYELHGELEQRNRRLDAVNERLRRFSRQMEYVIREKEVLAAKVRVHDDVGRSLLAFRSYLKQPEGERDREKLLLLWRRAVTLMKNEADPDGPDDNWDDLLQRARLSHVTVTRRGELPESERDRGVLMAALRECMTNTVKHAGGDEVVLSLTENEKEITAEITNNGAPPRREIQETGGLKNLRLLAETADAAMTIESTPRFLLRLVFQKGEKPAWEK